ncbi:hypothetical protein GCM10028857_05050 [Salinarchaeum chitinilyticum]
MHSGYFDAYQLIHEDPFSGEYQVKIGQSSNFRRFLFRAVQDFGINRDEHKLTNRGICNEFHEMLIEIAEEEGTDLSESEFNREFHRKKGELFSDWLGGDPESYTIAFPIMMRSKHFPNQVEFYGSKAEQIGNEEWESYLNTSIEAEDSNFSTLLDELPNDFESDHPLDRREWTYLKVNIEGRDRLYPLLEVSNLIEIKFAEINFFDHLWGSDMPQPASSDRVPNEKWSRLQEPPFYLVFKDGDYVTHRMVDYDYRRSIGRFHFSQTDISDVSEIPTFDYDAEKGTYEGHIVAALLAYQDGMTERSVRQSFFSFWRGIEILSNTSNSSKMVDRGEFAVSYHHDGESSFLPEMRDAIEEIENIRHKLVHEGLKTEVHRGHRNGAKVLLDGLLYLYIQKFDDWDLDDMASFLRHGVEYQEKMQFLSTLINKMSE